MASCRSSLPWLAGSLLICGALLFSPTAFAAEQTYTNSIGMEFILIPAGSFNMGADINSRGAADDESPVHRVSISKPFYLGKFEVTQAQWMAIMGSNPSHFKGQNNPVEKVSWGDAQAFIQKLNAKEGHNRYRLPTEAEWEYAARAGTDSVYSFGDDATSLGQYAWYTANPGNATHPVGQKRPNPWGFYDMYGNVWEWVQDWHDGNYYSNSPSTDPMGPSSGLYRGYRGGSWRGSKRSCRSAYRYNASPDYGSSDIGFRLVLSPE